MAEIVGITIAIAQITPAIIGYIRNVNTSGVVLLLRDLAQETTSADSWSAYLQSQGELLTQYERQLQDVAQGLQKAATSKREALKWPFEKKVIAETLASMERYKTDFLLALQTVQSEVSGSIKRSLEDVGTDIRQTREAIEWLRDSQQNRDTEMMLQWISPLNFQLVHNDNLQRRLGGTGEWVLRELSFKSWMSADLDTLCCEGIPGAGKTVIASLVVNYLRLQGGMAASVTQPANFSSGLLDSGVACIFCMYKERATQTAENLFGSIIRQLAEEHPKKLFPFVKELYEARNKSHGRPLSTDLVSMLGSMLRSFQRNYIVVDALDECGDEVKDDMLSGFEKLQKICNLKIMFTSRPGTITGLADYPKAGFLEIRARNEDIGKYISARVASERRSFASFRSKPELVALAIGTITVRSQGMFLLARLHLDSVARTTSAAALKASLHHLPRKLHDTYDEAIRRIENQDDEHADLAKKVLSWILYASRSMTMLELQHALAIESTESNQGVDEEYIINASDIIYSCAGLVILDKKTDVIRMVHFSAQEYFSATRQTHFPDGHVTIAAACLKYLTSDLFSHGHFKNETEMQIQRNDCPFMDYAAQFWGHHARESRSHDALSSAITNFMRLKSNLSCATQTAMQQFIYHSWAKHPADTSILPPLLVAANFGLVDIMISLLEQGADVNESAPPSDGIGALGIASQNGHLDIVKILLDRGANLRKSQRHGISPLHRAASTNHLKVVRFIVQHDQETIHLRNRYEKTALHDAAERGFADILQVLIQHGADLRAKDKEKDTPLSYAAASGNISCVQLLLEAGVPIDHTEAGVAQATYTAGASSQHSMLQYLFDRGAVVDIRGCHNNNVLHGTVCGGADPAIIRLIMGIAKEQGKIHSLLNGCNMYLKSPLHDAVERNKLAAVSILLEYDPEMEADRDGRTPLHWAVSKNYPAMTKLLLEKNRDPGFVNKRAGPKFRKMTALEMAVDKQYVQIIKIISEAL
ncbi:MAG: hypothetical protein Q9223_000908 [Gallowayella weberi]